MSLPKTEKLTFRFDRNVIFTKWHFSHSPAKFSKKYDFRSLLGRFRKRCRCPGEFFGDTSGGTIGKNNAHRGNTREKPRPSGKAQPGKAKRSARGGPNQARTSQRKPKCRANTANQARTSQREPTRAGPKALRRGFLSN